MCTLKSLVHSQNQYNLEGFRKNIPSTNIRDSGGNPIDSTCDSASTAFRCQILLNGEIFLDEGSSTLLFHDGGHGKQVVVFDSWEDEFFFGLVDVADSRSNFGVDVVSLGGGKIAAHK